MAANKKTPLLIVALLFMSFALYLILSTPAEEEEVITTTTITPTGETITTTSTIPYVHPCPYADILGLDEHSENPHLAGGPLPPMPPTQRKLHAEEKTFDPTQVVHAEKEKVEDVDHNPHYIGRSDFDSSPPIPPARLKEEL